MGFAGIGRNFSGSDNSRITILPVPYDKTSTWIKGADKGPFAVIEASPALEWYDIETGTEVYRNGIYIASPLKTNYPPEKMVQEVEKSVSVFLDAGKFVVVLGGEHSVSAGAVKAFSMRSKGLTVLQLDAHSDLRDEYEGSRFNHACVMSRVIEIAPAVQVGIRSMDVSEKARMIKENVFFAKDIVGRKDWFDKVVSKIRTRDVYVTIDVDVFDPSIMPSTGTPEPGGLDWYEVTGLLKRVAEKKNVVGFDCVELCPQKDNKAPDFVAAKLVYTFLSYIFAKESVKRQA